MQALLALLLSAMALAALDPDCHERYLRLLEPQKTAPTTAPLRIAMPLSPRNLEKGFSLAREAWQKNMERLRLRKALLGVESDPYAAEDFLSRLQKARKFAGLLRSQYLFLSEGHSAPTELVHFTDRIGALNDAIANKGRARELRELAKETLSALDALSPAVASDKFQMASAASIQSRMETIRLSLENVTGAELTTPYAFQNARKSLKELLAFFQSQEALEPSQEIRSTYDFLFKLNEDMGRIHSDFITQARNGEIDYHHQKFFLNSVLKEKLRALASALRGP